MTAQPVVIFGGFLSFPSAYEGMRATLETLSGQRGWIVPAYTHEWMTTVVPAGWAWLLRKLDATVRAAARQSATGKVTVIGHSSGGVMARLYLGSKPFEGCVFNGREVMDTLITLGSPHYNYRGGHNRRRVEAWYPGAYFAPEVRYISVAGKVREGKRHGTFGERVLFSTYQQQCGNGETWGDGFVPLESALLAGSQPVILEGARHYGLRGEAWYGTPGMVEAWWRAVINRP
jgi:hypothetical protein